METRVESLDGRPIAETVIHDFKTALRGPLLRPGTPEYEDARRIWNANIEKHPALIAKCTGLADIKHSVNFARENNLLVSIKGGGHSIPGLGLCDGGLTIDLSSLKGVKVDPEGKTAVAGAGVTWGEYDHETQLHGLASTGGEISTTGISGLTLGGGNGWLNGMFGTSCDNLIGAQVVTADGAFRIVNQDQEKDLFWGLRGGGGNFGVVSSLKYKIHPVGKVLGGFVGWNLDRTREVMEFLEGFVRDLPDEVGKIGVEVIASREGVPMVIIRPGYFGPIEEGQKLLAPIQKLGKPKYDNLRAMSYEVLQSSRDEYWPWGRHNYFKSGFVEALTDDVIETFVAHTRNVPSQHSQIAVEYYHGAYSRVKPDETAYPHRLTGWNLAIGGSWLDASESERNISWVRAFWDDIEPLMSGGVYVNFMSAGEDDRVNVAYGKNYDRLVSVKNTYDPTNLFKVNENIKPSFSSKK
ncbi:MAG TPA: FAD-binding oxidoreductase [Nitrososphaerales archaeon]|nr:FAD-binding oxidoreductase [Nitrososphaerales archaeon]